MVVRTNTPKVAQARAAAVELMLAAHTGDCVLDPNADRCRLHNLAADRQVGAPRFLIPKPRFYPREDGNPFVVRDLKKCIMCRKCVTACREIAGRNVLAVGYRGFQSKIVFGLDEALAGDECRDCGICVEHCPTGALSGPVAPKKARPPLRDSAPAGLLPALKSEVAARGFLSREAMEEAARKSGVSLSEVFGVASFYSFLPRAEAANRIRICRCVPCEMQGAETILRTLKEELGIGPGETTADGRFAIEVVGCIGACDQAPAILINDRLYGGLTADKLKAILKDY
jgi:NADH:ubiquinone oxidoreductase subunit E/Pyruvate/2-oxoacid:ferredoxin oxidoreductase delta subunit